MWRLTICGSRWVLCVVSVLSGLVSGTNADTREPPSFLKKGDVWVFHGDSITHADTYRRLCERTFRHYHPDGAVEFVQAGVWGSASSDLANRLKQEGRKPTVVSLMTGMNNAINGAWVKGQPRDKYLAAYRKDLTGFVTKYKAEGAAVILMSPTLTDESCRRTFFRIEGATDFLRDCRTIVQEVAAAEGAFYVPIQEEFEAFQSSLGAKQRLRPDGVHPSSWGEYRIGQSLVERLNFAGELGAGERRLTEFGERLAVALTPVSRRMAPGAKALEFILEPMTNTAVGAVTVTWSLDGSRKEETVTVTGKTVWALAPEAGLPALKPGESTEAVVELRAGPKRAVFVADLAAVPVLHFKGNCISGTVESVTDRPEGRRVAAWRLERKGAELLAEVEVADSQIVSSSEWAYARDGLDLFLDLRPAARLGGVNVDDDVHQLMINYYEQPFVAAALRPWLGAGLDHAALCGGEKTAAGYRLRLRLGDRLNLQEPFALDKRDFVGLSLAVTDADPDEKGNPRVVMHELFTAPRARDQYANGLAILDLKDALSGDAAINVSVFPAAP